jgi:putative transposase
MPRRSRLTLAGLPLHVMQRGNNRSACFATDADRRVYLSILRELCAEFPCDLHAFVLMTNHVHLLATPRQAGNVSLLMKHLGQEYVQYFNRTHGRSGSLWEGRFRSSIVDSDGYFLVCQRYIELNPVRAGMVRHPAEYPWSSFGANAHGERDGLTRPHSVYLDLGKDDASRTRNYRASFEEHLTLDQLREIRDAINGSFALGGKGFIATIEQLTQRRVSRRGPGRPRKAVAAV